MWVPKTFFQTQTASPSASNGVYGAGVDFIPDSGYWLLPIHLGLSTQNVGSETVNVQVLGTFTDGTVGGATTGSNYTTTTGAIDDQNQLYATIGNPNGNSGQRSTDRILKKLTVSFKSTIDSSGATVIYRVWGLQIPMSKEFE